ncbi:MFS transporter [Patescibacteria group bacterium]|nr:MFS transporter [Patescibacteria group bacterium]
MMIRLTPNKVIKYLILSDLVFYTGWGFINPIFAIFVVERIQNGSVFVVGVAAAVFWITKSLLRIPIGVFLDTCPSEKDDYLSLVAGLFIAALVPFGYIFAKIPLHIYILQGIHGLGLAMSLSGWTAIFTRHIDRGREATDWGLDATSIGLGTAIAAAVGGWAVTKFGFTPVLISVGFFGLIGVALLFGLRNEIRGVFDHKLLDHGLYFHLKDIFHREKK